MSSLLELILGSKQQTSVTKEPIKNIAFLSIDLELNGLDPYVASIVSIGWIEAKSLMLDIGSSVHKIIKTDVDLAQTPVIHHLTQEDIEEGGDIEPVLQQLANMAHSHVWVFHHHQLDWQVLKRYFEQNQIKCPKPIMVDTLLLEKYILEKQSDVLPKNALGLSVCRERYGLPEALAHSALDDASATLELLFCQFLKLAPKANMKLIDLKHTGALIL